MSLIHRRLGPKLFPSILWHTNEQAVHLTFDDGPHPHATPAVLDILRRRGARATFFVVGARAMQYQELIKAIAQEGHAIGNHSYSHAWLFLKPKAVQACEIQKADETIAHIIGAKPSFFRPPHGWFDHNTLDIAKSTNHTVVLWDVDPRDFSTRSNDTVTEYVGHKAHRGSIVLLHDNDLTQRKIGGILTGILDRLQDRGIDISPLPV